MLIVSNYGYEKCRLVVNMNTRVCIKHFEDRFLIEQFKFTIDGIKRTELRERPSLTNDAFPTVFPSLHYRRICKHRYHQNLDTDDRAEACERDSAVKDRFLADDLITSYIRAFCCSVRNKN